MLFLWLTIITQVGGLVYLLALLAGKRFIRRRGSVVLSFIVLYGLVWLLLPTLAGRYDRVPLPLRASAEMPLQPQNVWMVLTNRHYVRPELRDATLAAVQAFHRRYPDVNLTYLDATFPLFYDFPLLPHMRHTNGTRLDLAYIYRHEGGLTSRAPAFFGYGRSEPARPGETDQPAECDAEGAWQYSLLVPLAAPFRSDDYVFDEAATAYWLRCLVDQPRLERVSLEPHLKERFGFGTVDKVRSYSCWAVRHDDHVHVQL